jgi:hypothetical protein
MVEVVDNWKPLAKMIAVQLKARCSNDYPLKDADGYSRYI